MEIVLNGASYAVPAGSTVADLIQQLGLGDGRLAVEINLDVVPRGEHAQRVLCANDRVEVVHAIGGGSV